MSQASKKQATLEQAGFDRGMSSSGGTGARTPQALKPQGNKQGASAVTPGSPGANKGKNNKGRQGGNTRKSLRTGRATTKPPGQQLEKDKSPRRVQEHGNGKQQGGSASLTSTQSVAARSKDKRSKNKRQTRKQGGKAGRQHHKDGADSQATELTAPSNQGVNKPPP